MIKVVYSKNEIGYTYINVSGHANFDVHGKDIVCSAVSMLCYAIANKIINLNNGFDVKLNENEFIFNNDNNDSNINLLLETLIEGLYMVEDQYKDFIKIKED